MKIDGSLIKIYNLMLERLGPQHWWPGETPFEVVVGAILTQNTAWINVARAIKNIKDAGCLEPASLYSLNLSELAELIRPCGYYMIKAKRLNAFLSHLFINHGGNLEKMFNRKVGALRNELLGIKGIGPETADSIILYAASKPVFVVDAYTKRIFSRHGFFPETWGYNEIQSFFMDRLPKDLYIYNEYHALIVRLAKEHCKKRPICQNCILESTKSQNEIEGIKGIKCPN